MFNYRRLFKKDFNYYKDKPQRDYCYIGNTLEDSIITDADMTSVLNK
jgi:hypothetical protein